MSFPGNSRHRGVWALVASSALAALAIGWFVWGGTDSPPPRLPVAAIEAPPSNPEVETEPKAKVFVSKEPLPPQISNLPSTITQPLPSAPIPPIPEPALGDLAQRFRLARDRETQRDLLDQIAGRNDAEAVRTLSSLFPSVRVPELKEALIAKLADIDPGAAPDQRYALLATAIKGQPRNVRSAAMDVLVQFDEPRAIALLRRAAQDDPDSLLRQTAAEMVRMAEEQ